MTTDTCCLDARDGRLCTCSSWTAGPPADSARSWTRPSARRSLLTDLAAVIAVAVGIAVLALLVLHVRPFLCDLHEGQLRYCAAYPTNEESR
ncbi:MAG: hypothetical protein JWP11_3713 [Frankiales bacterium]|nr:hypothetical protein [Frankiales bacterium]